MSILRSVVISFAMFSQIPMPRVDWNKKNMRYTMAAFPLVGVLVGAVVYGWCWLAARLGFGLLLGAAGVFLLPALLTGGIHLDGFCDVADALASHAEPEKKQEILKDSHIGAFAAIALAIYTVAYVAFASELPFLGIASGQWQPLPALGLAALFVLSRSLSGLAVVFFPCARSSGLAHTFADAAARAVSGVVLGLLALGAAAAMLWCAGAGGVAALAGAALALVLYYATAKRQFGGISGDLAGWFLQLCELFGIIGLAVFL